MAVYSTALLAPFPRPTNLDDQALPFVALASLAPVSQVILAMPYVPTRTSSSRDTISGFSWVISAFHTRLGTFLFVILNPEPSFADTACTKEQQQPNQSRIYTPPRWCAAPSTTMDRVSRARPLQPSSSARPSCSVRSSAVSCSSPQYSSLGTTAISEMHRVAPRPHRRWEWATIRRRSACLGTFRLHRPTHVHRLTRALGVRVMVANGRAGVHRNGYDRSGIGNSVHLYQLCS
ncbi:hypothetical protein BJV74DRAFT_817230 [Russula compacta]|nr:hypothetical protein BJV74DRAFT_817230 [Russula compacta]